MFLLLLLNKQTKLGYLLSAVSLQSKRESMINMVNKMFIEIRLCNPMTYVFKGHVKVGPSKSLKF